VLIVDKVEFTFPSTLKCQFSFQVPTGKVLVIMGKSGSGKSTLLNLIAGFYVPTSGTITFNDMLFNPLKPANRPISMLFQENNLFEHLTVTQNVALGIHPGLKLSSIQSQQVSETLEKVGLAAKQNQLPNQLSGGQRQRVALARCLVRNKPLLLLDEPFTALDSKTKFELLKMIKEFQIAQNITLLFASHQREEADMIADNFIEIDHGNIINQGAMNELNM
jgi:thiamine transport system ATP-binding protein